jgi:hypothetical protein
VGGSCEDDNEPSGTIIRYGEFLDQVSDYQLFKTTLLHGVS